MFVYRNYPEYLCSSSSSRSVTAPLIQSTHGLLWTKACLIKLMDRDTLHTAININIYIFMVMGWGDRFILSQLLCDVYVSLNGESNQTQEHLPLWIYRMRDFKQWLYRPQQLVAGRAAADRHCSPVYSQPGELTVHVNKVIELYYSLKQPWTGHSSLTVTTTENHHPTLHHIIRSSSVVGLLRPDTY